MEQPEQFKPSDKSLNRRPIWQAVLTIVLVVGIFGTGFFIARTYFPKKIVYTGIANLDLGQPEDIDFSLFWDTYNLIQEKHVDRDNLDYQELLFGAIGGLVEAVGDPHTNFFTPTSTKEFLESIRGSFEGIGAEIDIRDEILIIVAPLRNTPADRVGLRPGDKVVMIDGESTAGITIEEAVRKIRGPKGSVVTLTIRRENDFDEDLEFQIKRATINIPAVAYELRDDVNYIQIFQFSETLPFEFRRIVFDVLRSGNDRLILDLRNNPGGFLEAAVEITSYFLPEGETVVIEDFGNGNKNSFRSEGFDQLGDFKIVILVNEGSASASEIVAGALRDLKKVQLIGMKTFGKGSVQELLELREGTSLKLTIANWLTPKGNLIADKGLEPDITVEITNEDIEEGRDPQFDRAIEVVKSL